MPSASTAVSEAPILMADDMARATLEDRKTMTRRIVKWKPREEGLNLSFSGLSLAYYMTDMPESGWVLSSRGAGGCWNDRTYPIHCPYGRVGDRLWVREAFLPCKGCGTPCKPSDASYVCFRDGAQKFGRDENVHNWTGSTPPDWSGYKFSPSIHMPRWASRLTLEITSVRVERVQEISIEDVWAEGVQVPTSPEGNLIVQVSGCPKPADYVPDGFFHPGRKWSDDDRALFIRAHFAALWDRINGVGAWERNPWVWALAFKRSEAASA